MSEFDAGLFTGIPLGCAVTAIGYLLGTWVLRRVADLCAIWRFTRRR